MTELSSDELRFIFNTFSFLLWGALVMWMAAGFTMLESGSVRTKNASVICLKNIGLYSVAGIAYYVIGLQPDVRRRRQRDRLVPLPPRSVGGRGWRCWRARRVRGRR